MRRFKKLMTVLCSAVWAFSLLATPVYADTDGTEIQVVESSQLEIQLGTAWSGVEFQLRTDVGMYPNTIIVGEDGVLRLEIGGSSTYTLTCLNSGVAAPQIGEAISTETANPDAEATLEPEQMDAAQQTPDQTEFSADPDVPETQAPDGSAEESDEDTKEGFAGIPTMHIVLFGGGLLLAVGGLIAIRVVNKRREERDDYDDDYDDEE